MSLMEDLDRWIAGLRSKVANMVLKSLIESVNDSTPVQLVKVSALAGEIDDAVERIQNYGFTSVPPGGGESIQLTVGGDRDHPVIIVADSAEYRKKGLQSGEAAVYHKNGAYVLMKANGDIEVKADGKNVIVEGVAVQLGGTSGLEKLIDKRLEAAYNAHIHPAGTPNTGVPTVLLGDGGPPALPVSTSITEAK